MKFLFSVLFLLATAICFGQESSAPVKKHNVYYYNNKNERVYTIDSTDYIQIVIEPDSGSKLYNVEEYYKNKSPRFIGKSSKINPVWLQDQSLAYYPNGKKKQIATYENNQMVGPVIQYYPNGKPYLFKEYLKTATNSKPLDEKDSLITAEYDSTGKATIEEGNGYYTQYSNDFKNVVEEGPVKNGHPNGIWKGKEPDRKITFEEEYLDGKLIKGAATDSTGKITTYQQRTIPPQFRGGIQGLGRYLGNNIRYPQSAREKNIEGIVVLKFIVKRDGSIGKIQITQSAESSLDQEALRVVKSMPNWIPGMAYGGPVSFIYSVPINFALR